MRTWIVSEIGLLGNWKLYHVFLIIFCWCVHTTYNECSTNFLTPMCVHRHINWDYIFIYAHVSYITYNVNKCCKKSFSNGMFSEFVRIVYYYKNKQKVWVKFCHGVSCVPYSVPYHTMVKKKTNIRLEKDTQIYFYVCKYELQKRIRIFCGLMGIGVLR